MARAAVKVRVETRRRAPSWYVTLFQELFPAEWREYAKGIVRQTLAEVLAESPEELARITHDAPPVEVFVDLMNRHYFPIPDIWEEWADIETDEGTESYDGWLFNEIPIDTFFTPISADDVHYTHKVFQVLATLDGQEVYHERCNTACDLKAIYLIAANELHVVNRPLLRALCRRERSPLRHLDLSLGVLLQDTGNIWFDMNYEYYSETGVSWSAGNVRELKRKFERAQGESQKVLELNRWLEADIRRVRDATALWRRAAVR